MPISNDARARMLAALAPDESPVYFALFADADAQVELAVAGYQRVAYVGGWLMADAMRVNAAAAVWPPMPDGAVARAVGFFDKPIGGQALGSSRTLTLQGEETEVVIEPGDLCSLPPGAVRLSATSQGVGA